MAKDEVAIAGLEKAHVDQFEALGFERSKVVSLHLVDPAALFRWRQVLTRSLFLL